MVFVGMRDNKLQELYELKDKQENQITFFNEWVVKEKKLSKPQRITFNTKEGMEIEGWIMKPIDFDETKKYPEIGRAHV